jgi:hypothetical protein
MKYVVILYCVQNLDDRGADIGHLLQRGMSKLRPVRLSENTATQQVAYVCDVKLKCVVSDTHIV